MPAVSEAGKGGPAREVEGLARKEALTGFRHQAQPGPDSMQSRQVLTLYLLHSWERTGGEMRPALSHQSRLAQGAAIMDGADK